MNYLLNGTVIKRLAVVTGLTLALSACLHDDDDTTTPPVDTNNAPVITSTASTSVEEGAAFSYTLTATDADGDALTLAASTLPAWLTFDAATGALSGTPAASDVGDHSVTLTVSDGTDTTTQSFTVTVTAIVVANTPPVITSTAITTATVDSAYSYTLTATDADDDTLSFSSITLPSWANFDTSTGILSGTPDAAGDYAVELMVSDDTDSVNQAFSISATVQSDAALIVFENAALPEWAAWDCCGGSTAVIKTDDAEHDQTTEFTINGDTVVGFTARDADGAVGGMPFDASAIAAEGTITFELKMTTAPDAGAVDWRFKVESVGAATAAEVSLTSSQEMHAGPALDTWQTYTFNIADLVAAGLDASAIDVLMVFPAWGSGNGAVFLLDNVKILADGNVAAPPPPSAALTVFENAPLPEWAAWDCCGGSTAVVKADDAEHDQTTEFTINGDTVVGFTARDADGAVGGMPFDASAIAAEGTITFELKMTTAPDAGAVDWRFKVESVGAATAAEVSLTSSQEMHAGPALDTWQTYTFNIADLVAAGLDASAIDVLMVFPAWGSGNGAVFLLDNVKILADGNAEAPPPPPAVALTVFENDALPEWAAWDCCGGSTAVIKTDDVDHDQTTEFTINGDTVVGFTARDADGAVGGMPYDASSIAAEGTITFELKMTTAPDAGAVDWRFKVESNNAATFAEVSLTSSQEQHSGPVLDTWQTYTFNIADLVAAGLDASGIDVLMVFPAWGSGNGAVFLLDNVKILTDGKVIVPENNQMNLDFEADGAGDAGYTWVVFENDDNPALEVVANPAADLVNASSTVAKFTARQTGMPWAGTETKSGPTFTLDATNSIVKIMVYKTVISDVGIKFAVGAAAQPELKVANTKVNEWEELTFDFSGYIGLAETINIDTVIVFPDFNLDGRASDTVNYFDNLTFNSSEGN